MALIKLVAAQMLFPFLEPKKKQVHVVPYNYSLYTLQISWWQDKFSCSTNVCHKKDEKTPTHLNSSLTCVVELRVFCMLNTVALLWLLKGLVSFVASLNMFQKYIYSMFCYNIPSEITHGGRQVFLISRGLYWCH